MEQPRTQPIFIENVVNETFTDQYEKECEEWEDLEQFWGEEKQRLQDVDGQVKPLSSSLEKYLLENNFLNEPQRKSSLKEDFDSRTVRGEDIADIPTTYTAKAFKPHELIVTGTYVDKDIIPGFRYKVRKNFSEEYLFKGKAKYLLNVGLGYGKRLSFEDDTLNETENYFWSDSAIHGYGFTLQTISNDDVFHILDTKTGQVIGRVLVNKPSLKEDKVLTTMIGERGYIEKEVAVQFSCVAILSDTSNKQSLFVDDISIQGKAIVVRESSSSKGKVNQIFLDDFMIDSCLLIPEE